MSTKKKAAKGKATPRLTVRAVHDKAMEDCGAAWKLASEAGRAAGIARRETGNIMNRLVAIERALERNDTIAKANRAPEVCAEINKLILTNNDQMRSEVAQIAKTLDCHAQINSANSQQIGDVRTRLNQITVEMEAITTQIAREKKQREAEASESAKQIILAVDSATFIYKESLGYMHERITTLEEYARQTTWQRIKGWFGV